MKNSGFREKTEDVREKRVMRIWEEKMKKCTLLITTRP